MSRSGQFVGRKGPTRFLRYRDFRLISFGFPDPKNVARKLFSFGAEMKKISRQNEIFLAPLFQKTRAGIGAF